MLIQEVNQKKISECAPVLIDRDNDNGDFLQCAVASFSMVKIATRCGIVLTIFLAIVGRDKKRHPFLHPMPIFSRSVHHEVFNERLCYSIGLITHCRYVSSTGVEDSLRLIFPPFHDPEPICR